MGLKDFIETRGVRTSFGTHLMANNIPKQDSVVAARLRSAGAVFLGKTTATRPRLEGHGRQPPYRDLP